MSMRLVSATAAILAVLFLAGCSGDDAAVPKTEAGAAESDGEQGSSHQSEASRAAKARGVPVESEVDEGPPVLTLEGISYDWRVTPNPGLLVSLQFGNANEVFERARAYVFIVATYSARSASSRGAFPLGTEFEGDNPADYTKGTHIVYRKDHTMKCFIPYTDREGYYDSLRVIVYSEDGNVLKDQSYKLEVDGEPTGPVKMRPSLTL